MRFSKAPLIATLMAVVLSLLVILPALAEQTDGQVTHGEGKASELIVGVYDPNEVNEDTDGNAIAWTDRLIPGSPVTGATNARTPQPAVLESENLFPKDTFFDGKLYVSNRHNPLGTVGSLEGGYNTVLVTQRGPTFDACLVVTVTNTRSGGGSIKLVLVPSTPAVQQQIDADGDGNTEDYRYFQNYFRVADADFGRTGPADAASPRASAGVYECAVASTNAEGVRNNGALTPATDSAGVPLGPAQITARDGDRLRITAGSWVQELYVDGTGPEFSSVTPADGTIQDSSTLRIAFTVRDDGSGLRHDGEDNGTGGDMDPNRSNADGDAAYHTEPKSDENGKSVDIGVLIAATGTGAGSLDDIVHYDAGTATVGATGYTDPRDYLKHDADRSGNGSGDWQMIERGAAYRLSLNYNAGQTTDFEWQLVAVDRVGNASYTDAKPSKTASQPYTLTIDNDSPIVVWARTGVTYDDKSFTVGEVEIEGKEKEDDSFIALAFENDNLSGPDKLDHSKIDYTRFLLETDADAEPISVVGFIHSTDDEGQGLDADITPSSLVYLELSRPLGSDETPDVQVLSGAVSDLAGNTNAPSLITPEDKIKPGFTVTITTDVTGRPAIGDDGEFEVVVTSDEELLRPPTIYVASIKEAARKTAIDNVKNSRLSPDGANAWSQTLDDGDLPGGGGDGLYAVIVVGEDVNRNAGGTDGWEGKGATPGIGDELNLVVLDSHVLLIERDTKLDKPTIEFAPDVTSDSSYVTESRNPFMRLHFEMEGKETEIDSKASLIVEKTALKDKSTTTSTTVKLDSHASVTLGAVTLDGEAVDASQLRTLGSNEFLVQLNGLDDRQA